MPETRRQFRPVFSLQRQSLTPRSTVEATKYMVQDMSGRSLLDRRQSLLAILWDGYSPVLKYTCVSVSSVSWVPSRVSGDTSHVDTRTAGLMSARGVFSVGSENTSSSNLHGDRSVRVWRHTAGAHLSAWMQTPQSLAYQEKTAIRELTGREIIVFVAMRAVSLQPA